MNEIDKHIEQSVMIIRKRKPDFTPRIAITLGSGLGAVADLMADKTVIPYSNLPGFPVPSVQGHEGAVILGTIESVPALFMKGRQHLYEGEGAKAMKIMIRTLKTIGVELLFLTNAAGSLRAEYGPGSLIAISDHINMTGFNPLVGTNDNKWGPRFPPMENAWDSKTREILMQVGQAEGIAPLGEGVYCQHMGPTFETPAEVRMSKAIGADTVGMSTAVENIIARHCGMKCVGVSAITNLGAGMSNEALSHDQTLAGAKLAEENMAKLVKAFIRAWA